MTSYAVDDLTIDVGQRHVSREGELLDVSGLTFDLLVTLIEAAPDIVSYDELTSKVWGGRQTSPETITQRVAMLRHALDDDAENPKYVDVVRGQGLRLIPGVRSKVPVSRQSPGKLIVRAAIAVVALVLIFVLFPTPDDRETDSRLPNSIAVLPFENISPDPGDAYFADGLHREIINRLASIGDIHVISQRAVSPYADTTYDISLIAEKYRVETILEGSVGISGEAFRLTLQLVDAETAAILWAEEFHGDLSDVFATQAEVATKIALALEARLTEAEVAMLTADETANSEAVRRYLQGKSVNLSRGQRIVHLSAAISADPQFARALADRAYLRANDLPELILEGANEEEIDAINQVIIEDANRALSIDPNLGYAHVALAQRNSFLGNPSDALDEFNSALRLSPHDPAVLDRLGGYYSRLGEHDKAIQTLELAIEFDPDNGELYDALGDALFYTDQLERTAEQYRRALDLGYDSAGTIIRLAIAESSMGNLAQGERYLRQAEATLAEQNRTIWPIVAYSFSAIGQQEDAERLARQLRDSQAGGQVIHPILQASLGLAERDAGVALAALADVVENMGAGTINFSNRLSWYVIAENMLNDPMLDEADFLKMREQMKAIYK